MKVKETEKESENANDRGISSEKRVKIENKSHSFITKKSYIDIHSTLMQMLLNHKMITKFRNINLHINENINSTMNYKNHISILTEFCLLCNLHYFYQPESYFRIFYLCM